MFRHASHRVWCYLAGMFLLGSVVALHEGGHWYASEICGVHCPTFNLGFGPGVKVGSINQTEIWLRAIPLGGSVELPMNSSATNIAIGDLSLGAKLFVFGAGIVVNLISGVLLIWCHLKIEDGSGTEERAAYLMVDSAIRSAREDAKFKFRSKFLGLTAQRIAERFLNYCATSANILTSLSEGGMTGWRGVVWEATVLSIVVAIVNILPVPPLDGSRIFDALFYGGVLSGGRAVEAISASETVCVHLGLVFLLAPIVLGLIPGAVMACRFEVALYKRLRENREQEKVGK